MSFHQLKAVVLRSIRLAVIAFACTLLMFTNAFPALAIGSPNTDLSKSEEPLDETFEKSENVLKKDPLSLEETQREANKGLNEIQGDADIENMYTPENSREATSAEDQVTRALERLTGRD